LNIGGIIIIEVREAPKEKTMTTNELTKAIVGLDEEIKGLSNRMATVDAKLASDDIDQRAMGFVQYDRIAPRLRRLQGQQAEWFVELIGKVGAVEAVAMVEGARNA
jgi:hypothetical protein